jgi:hypothetical protein
MVDLAAERPSGRYRDCLAGLPMRWFTQISVNAIVLLPSIAMAGQVIDFSDVRLPQGTLQQALIRLSEELRDPASAQFRNLKLSTRGAVCGEVNAKTMSGRYAGFITFIVDGHNVVFGNGGRGGQLDDAANVSGRSHFIECR